MVKTARLARAITAACVSAAVVSGCGGSTQPSTDSGGYRPGLPAQGGPGILGATDGDWDRAHVMDAGSGSVQAGMVYDAGTYDANQDRFVSVIHDNGRVTSFDLNYPSGTGIDAAVQGALQLVPPDATHGPVVVLDNCAALDVQSATLQRDLGSPNAVVFFTSGADGASYDPGAVADSEIVAGQTVPASC